MLKFLLEDHLTANVFIALQFLANPEWQTQSRFKMNVFQEPCKDVAVFGFIHTQDVYPDLIRRAKGNLRAGDGQLKEQGSPGSTGILPNHAWLQ